MIVEVEDKTLANMEEDIQTYIKIIKKYNETLNFKNECIESQNETIDNLKILVLSLLDSFDVSLFEEKQNEINKIKNLISEI